MMLMFQSRGGRDSLSEERERAYSLAREHLLRARGRAVFEMLSSLGDAANPSDVRVGLRAAALLRESVRLSPPPVSSSDIFNYSTSIDLGEPA